MCTEIKGGKVGLLAAAISALVLAGNAAAQTVDAVVPVTVNVAATVKVAPIAGVSGTGDSGSVTANAEKNFNIKLYRGGMNFAQAGNAVGVKPYQPNRQTAGAWISMKRGNVTINLSQQQYKNAAISLYSVNGKQILKANASASKGAASVSCASVPAGVYLLSVRGAKGNAFSTKLTHSGDRLNINAAFVGADNSLNKSAAAGDYAKWTITVSAPGYFTQTRAITPDAGTNPLETFTLEPPTATAKKNFTETVAGQSFDMVYVAGGTFTIGCEKSSGCPADTKPVEGVTVSNYFIGKTEVTIPLWNAVMGTKCANSYMCSGSYTTMTWFDAMAFACKLSALTGRNYRMPTEAEWEYAVKKSVAKGIDSLLMIGRNEEWAYNSWSGSHEGGTDPIGKNSGGYTQKTRRDAQGSADNITGRLIRSVEGKGPALRLVLSADTDYPPGYVNPCNLHMPEMDDGAVGNSYRDPRWLTGGAARWTVPEGATAIGSLDLRVWSDGTASMTPTFSGGGGSSRINGQWFTSNNIAFVFVPNPGTTKMSMSPPYGRVPDTIPRKYAYIFLDEMQGSLISETDFMDGGFIGRIIKESATEIAKPDVPNLMSGEALAKAQPGFDTLYKMIDMSKMSEMLMGGGKKKDPRLLDGPDVGWFQDNRAAGGLHHYRKDVDLDEFRFTVNQGGNQTMLANGDWFTINNTFLRVTHSTGYAVDYLYAVTKSATGDTLTFYHNSFMAYERGDFRMFKKVPNKSSVFAATCGSICEDEIPKGLAVSAYAPGGYMDNGHSTFKPAPCPSGGCK